MLPIYLAFIGAYEPSRMAAFFWRISFFARRATRSADGEKWVNAIWASGSMCISEQPPHRP